MVSAAGGSARAFLDTNVLIAATDDKRSAFVGARLVLNTWPNTGTVLYISGQVVREYLAVATRPRSADGMGMTMGESLVNVETMLARTTLLDETSATAQQLRALLARVECRGQQVHDANIVATMLVHGVGTLVTEYVARFERFADLIELISLR